MANYHSVSFAVAGSREAVNEAILLMAQNIAQTRRPKTTVKEFDDPAQSFSAYRQDLDESYFSAFAGAESLDRCLSETATVAFDGNDDACVLAMLYATAGRLNDEDLNTYFEALAQRCAFNACVIHGDEYDWYDQLRENHYWADGTGEWDASEDDEWPTAGDLASELRRIRRAGKIRNLTDPKDMAYAAAVSMWEDWGGDSVFDTLWESGIFGEDADEDEARELFDDYSNDIVLFYASRRRGPVTREKLEKRR